MLLRTITDQVSTNFDGGMAEAASAICIGRDVVGNTPRKHLVDGQHPPQISTASMRPSDRAFLRGDQIT